MKKTINLRSKQAILKDIQIPCSMKEQMTNRERGLLKMALANLTLTELARIYKTHRNRIELVWDLIYLGQTLAYLGLFNTKIFINWEKANKPGATYLEGFLDCKNQVREASKNGTRKKSRRKTQ